MFCVFFGKMSKKKKVPHKKSNPKNMKNAINAVKRYLIASRSFDVPKTELLNSISNVTYYP